MDEQGGSKPQPCGALGLTAQLAGSGQGRAVCAGRQALIIVLRRRWRAWPADEAVMGGPARSRGPGSRRAWRAVRQVGGNVATLLLFRWQPDRVANTAVSSIRVRLPPKALAENTTGERQVVA